MNKRLISLAGYLRKNKINKMINLYYNYFYSTESDERRSELDYCFSKLLNNRYIDKCYVMIDVKDIRNFQFKSKKIVIIKLKNQDKPFYQDYFDLATKYSADDDINIFLNSDCFLDDDDTVKLYDMNKNDFYCQSRFNIVTLEPFVTNKDQIKNNTQDCWIFRGKPKNINAKFSMGVKSCDNAIAYAILEAGYYPIDKPYDIKVYHYHVSSPMIEYPSNVGRGVLDWRPKWSFEHYNNLPRYVVDLVIDDEIIMKSRYEPPQVSKEELDKLNLIPLEELEKRTYQRKIINSTGKYRPIPKYPVYPPYHKDYYIEDFFFNYFVTNDVKTDRFYLPIFWTSCYNNNWFNKDSVPDIQSFLDILNPNFSYFTICQHEHAPGDELILPKNTLVFTSSGKIAQKNKSNKNILSIPLICSPIKNINLNKKRNIFCSFVGAETHKIRIKMKEFLKDDENYYISTDKWKINISKSKEDEFKEITERSIFALCPRGEGPTSFRLYEAMQLGAIPVYVYDFKWIPYDNDINWDDICIFIHENEINHIKDILEHISNDKIEKMRNNISILYDKYFTLESISSNIIEKLKNEKMKLITFYSDSHKILLDNYFLPSLKKFNEFEIIVEKINQNSEGYYGCDGWGETMTNKVDLIIKTINETWGNYFVYADCDIMFFDSMKDKLIEYIEDNDISFQDDSVTVCAGFFICKSNEKTLNLWKTVKDNVHNYNDDQESLRYHIDKVDIKYNKLPLIFSNIGHFNGQQRWEGNKNYDIPSNIIIFHANWTVGVQSKIELFNYIIDNISEEFNDFKIKDEKKYIFNFDNNVLIGSIDGDRMINPIYIKKTNLFKKLSFDEKKRFNVFYNYYKIENKDRENELNYCLDKLLSNDSIDNLYVLCSDSLDIDDEKLIKIDFNEEQPTFDDFFNIINLYTNKNDINIILNSDCYIDKENVEKIKINIQKNKIYCLSRWNITKFKPFKAEHYNIDCSQDAWCFIGEMHNLDADFKLGFPGCDNAIAYEFQKGGYEIINPSKDIKIYHYHFSNIRTYGVSHEDKERNRVKRQYVFIRSSFLDEKTETKEVIFEGIVESNKIIKNASNLNKFVDQVYVINLKRREDRLKHMTNEFNRFNISFNRFNAIDGQKLNLNMVNSKKSEVACLRSHMGIIKNAIDKGYDKIAIFEDDIIFCDDFEERFEYYSKMIPDDWDIMYLGCHFNSCKNPTSVKNYIFKVDECYGCFAMILTNKNGLFNKIIEVTKDESKPIDNYFHDDILKIFKAYVFIPFFVKTLNTVSDIGNRTDSFSYDIVDKYFKPRVNLPKIKNLNDIKPTEIHQKIEYVKSSREICEDYLRGTIPFQIFYDNRVIFDSSAADKINVNFFDNHFTVYGRMFRYQGMRIKMK